MRDTAARVNEFTRVGTSISTDGIGMLCLIFLQALLIPAARHNIELQVLRRDGITIGQLFCRYRSLRKGLLRRTISFPLYLYARGIASCSVICLTFIV